MLMTSKAQPAKVTAHSIARHSRRKANRIGSPQNAKIHPHDSLERAADKKLYPKTTGFVEV